MRLLKVMQKRHPIERASEADDLRVEFIEKVEGRPFAEAVAKTGARECVFVAPSGNDAEVGI